MGLQQRLVIVSNRAPAEGLGAGGLATALQDALSDRDALWFGWSGEVDENAPESAVRQQAFGPLTVALADLTEEERDGYYLGYSNLTLWPALHYRLDLSSFDPAHLKTYRAVNARFADQLADLVEPDDLIWIHDYHLIPLAAELRRRGLNNPIGFFLHIPFPPQEIFDAIPGGDALVEDILSYDLVGFQANRDRSNFERVALSQGAAYGPDGRLSKSGRLCRARAFPIGINAHAFRTLAEESPSQAVLAGEGVTAMIGVDRMDYSKGLPARMEAVGAFFEAHPEARGKLSLVQITPPSRGDLPAYADLRRELDEAAGHVIGRFARVDWSPVLYMARGLEREKLAALYRQAKIGLVTPLRDGMNLVAKEYVAAQDPGDPGVLILSEFAGAAEQLDEALLVNPHHPEAVADAIAKALDMPLEERRRRHAALWRSVSEEDAAWWCKRFEADLRSVRPEPGPPGRRLTKAFGDLSAAAR